MMFKTLASLHVRSSIFLPWNKEYGISNLALIALFALSNLFAVPVHAQNAGLSVTLTPPLFQLTIGPNDNWSSSLKVVNNNPYDVTYYAQVVDMEANGETGQSKFIPILGPQDPAFAASQLARWITLEPGPYTIKAGSSANIHFSVKIPENAEPGGHYAAILVGTQPLSASSTGSQMQISSYVSSLLFVRIKGDVHEQGRIREFTSDHSLYQTPNADFMLRFENTGNTHLKPAGNVTIYNMWGKERGKVLINQQSDFGNVLPNSIRKFQFSWEGEENVFDIGRYSAVVTLAYGEDGKKSVSATTYFWIVPLVPVAWTLGSIIAFIVLLAWFIRRYIKRALELERARFGIVTSEQTAPEFRPPILETIVEPLKEGVVDLRSLRNSVSQPSRASIRPVEMPVQPIPGLTTTQFIKKYRLFFAFIFVLVVSLMVLWVYFEKVLVPERGYNITNTPSQSEQIPE